MSPNETIVLQYKMSKGDQYVYEIGVDSHREVDASGTQQKEQDLLKMKMTQKVTGVNADGSYSLEMMVEPHKLIKNKEEIQLDPVQQKVIMKMTKSGEILETSLQGPATQPSFPTRPVSVGEEWEGESKVTLQDPTTGQPIPPIVLKFLYTLVGIEKINGYQCAHIRVTNPESDIALSQGVTQKIKAGGDTYFAYKEGRLIKSDVQTNIFMSLPEGTIQNQISISVLLIETPRSISAGEEFLISG